VLDHIRTEFKRRRHALGLSQADVAEAAGLQQSYYSRIELGRIEPRLSTLQDIARALQLEPMLVPFELADTVAAVVGQGPPAEEQPLFAATGDYYE
jgi:transcriptional regulator with XRE-family HTH domain